MQGVEVLGAPGCGCGQGVPCRRKGLWLATCASSAPHPGGHIFGGGQDSSRDPVAEARPPEPLLAPYCWCHPRHWGPGLRAAEGWRESWSQRGGRPSWESSSHPCGSGLRAGCSHSGQKGSSALGMSSHGSQPSPALPCVAQGTKQTLQRFALGTCGAGRCAVCRAGGEAFQGRAGAAAGARCPWRQDPLFLGNLSVSLSLQLIG